MRTTASKQRTVSGDRMAHPFQPSRAVTRTAANRVPATVDAIHNEEAMLCYVTGDGMCDLGPDVHCAAHCSCQRKCNEAAMIIQHHTGSLFHTTRPQRLISALVWRGWWEHRVRGGREMCRLWRNNEYISIDQRGLVVAYGWTAQAVLHELAQEDQLQ